MNMHQPIEQISRFRNSDFMAGTKSGNRKRLLFLALLALAAIVAAAWFLVGGETAPPPDSENSRPSVTVLVPGTSEVTATVNVTGSIGALRDMPVGVQGEGGAIVAVLVDAGDAVRAGQVLARVDRSVQTQQVAQLQASVVQAEADAKLAQADLDRALALVERGFISKADIDRRTATRDSANARVNVAVAQLREGQARLARLDIRAPEPGVILERNVEAGQVVSSGSPALFRMARGGVLEMEAKIAEQDLVRLKVGMNAVVTPVGQDGNNVNGTVWQLSPVVDPATRQGVARIRLEPNAGLRPGGFASAAIVAGTSVVPLLPEAAVQSDDAGAYVYIIDAGNRAVRRDVTIGRVTSEGITITKGLTGDEKVVYSAGAFLNPGDIVIPSLLTRK